MPPHYLNKRNNTVNGHNRISLSKDFDGVIGSIRLGVFGVAGLAQYYSFKFVRAVEFDSFDLAYYENGVFRYIFSAISIHKNYNKTGFKAITHLPIEGLSKFHKSCFFHYNWLLGKILFLNLY